MTQAIRQPTPARDDVDVQSAGAEGGEPVRPVSEHHHEHQAEPVSRQREQRDGRHRERRVDAPIRASLPCADHEAQGVTRDERQAHEHQRGGKRVAEDGTHGATGGDAPAPLATGDTTDPDGELHREGPVEAERVSLRGELRGRRRGPKEPLHGIPRRELDQEERERQDTRHHRCSRERAPSDLREHGPNLARASRPR